MASVTFKLPGAPPAPKAHRKCVIVQGNDRLYLPITRPDAEHSNLADEYAEADRPGRRPFLKRRASRLRKVRLHVEVIPRDGRSVQYHLDKLRRFALSGKVTVQWGPDLAHHRWRITDLTYKGVHREQGTNALTWASLELELTEANDLVIPQRITPQAPRQAPPPAPARPAGGRRHTIAAGQTLSAIALYVYGDAARWRVIADANKIRNPHLIYPGQVIVLP